MSESQSSFQLHAPPATDIWRKPPHANRFNAPRRMRHPIRLDEFLSARITFKGDWELLYDQAGILISFSDRPEQSSDDTYASKHPWIKAGVEMFKGNPHISFVGCDRYADWSLHPLETSHGVKAATRRDEPITVQLRRQGDENGSALWAYQLVLEDDGQTLTEYPIRECTWPFAEEYRDYWIEIGAYVARPSKETNAGELVVEFGEVEVMAKGAGETSQ